MAWILLAILMLLISGFILFLIRNTHKKQLAYIKQYPFQKSIKTKISGKYPHLKDEQIHLVFRALRDYFWICHQARRKIVSMPSQVVDDAWHEFILFTRSYETFCNKSLGRFLHHTPTEAMRSPTRATEGIKRAWRLACAKERINPLKPGRLPLIFAIDAMLEIPKGFNYVLNCQNKNSAGYGNGYCGGDIGCSSGCAGSSGADSSSDSHSGGFFDGFFDSFGGDGGCGSGCGGD